MATRGKQKSDGENDGFLNRCKKKVVETVKEVSTRQKKKRNKKPREEPMEESTATSPAAKGGKREKDFMRDLTEAQKANYEKFTRSVIATGVVELLREYNEQLKPYQAKQFKREIFDKNAAKNRYRDVVCNDLTRIVLEGKEGDYIHANLVKVEGCKNEFICTQGPTPTTTHEFWRMIVQNTVNHIIMLCEVVEQGKTKCEQYWPLKENEKMNFGDIHVTNTKVELDKKGAVMKTYLQVTKGSFSMELRHHLWKQWPDKLIPASSLAALRVLQAVRVSDRPIVVHCSAGIGRTGTMVAIELCLQKLITTGQLSLLQHCKKLRDCRMHSIQVELQYLYLAQTIMEYGKANTFWKDDELNSSLDKFKVQVDLLTRHNPRTKPTAAVASEDKKEPQKVAKMPKSDENVEKPKKVEEPKDDKKKEPEKEPETDKKQEDKLKEAAREKEELERKKKQEREREDKIEKEKEEQRRKKKEETKENRHEPRTCQNESEDHPKRPKKTPAKILGPIPVAPPHVVNASPPRVHVIRATLEHPAPVDPPKAATPVKEKDKDEPNYIIPKVAEAPAHTPVNVHVMSPAVSPAVSSPAKTPVKGHKAPSAETAEFNAITAYGGVNETPVVLADEVAPTPPATPEVPKTAAPEPPAPATSVSPAAPEPAAPTAPAAKKDEKEFINSVFM